jgi:uncharacterized protein involved in type VI secretion and phage assembly
MRIGHDPSLERSPLGQGGLFYGVYPAQVSDNQDPDHQGRVKVKLPWSPDPGGGTYETWARLSTTMAGNNRGTWFIPEVGDEVLVAFEAGHPRRPYVVGGLWNGQDAPPEQMDQQNNLRTLLSRSGVRMTMDDTSGSVKLRLETPGGHKVVLDDGQVSITIQDSSGNSATLDASGITLTAVSQAKISCATAEVDASTVTVNSPMSTFSGVVQCDTLIANTVVGASYTPGAGNIW